MRKFGLTQTDQHQPDTPTGPRIAFIPTAKYYLELDRLPAADVIVTVGQYYAIGR